MSAAAVTSSGLPGRLRKRTNSCFTTSLVVRDGRDKFGDRVFRIADRVADGRAADERHHGAELQVARSFAFAGAFAGRAAQVAQEAIG